MNGTNLPRELRAPTLGTKTVARWLDRSQISMLHLCAGKNYALFIFINLSYRAVENGVEVVEASCPIYV